MGLAQRKDKQRIGYDPRNLTWSEDKDRFSFKHMTALGWKENSGIGKDLAGNAKHIGVVRKADNGGIGMGRVMKEGQELSAGAGQAGAGLEDVLKRLAAKASASPRSSVAPSPTASPAPESSTPPVIRNKIAWVEGTEHADRSSRQRHLAAKRMASQSPAALAEILGVPQSSLPASPAESAPSSGASTPAEPEAESTPEPSDPDGRNALETISTSTMSVSDYFRQKLREKMLARQAASGSSTPVPTLAEGSLAALKGETKVSAPGAEWEGSKMTFEETTTTTTTIQSLGGDEPPVPSERKEKKEKSKKDKKSKSKDAEDEDKAAKKARKEAKRAARVEASSAEPSGPALSEKEEKRRRKEAKKAEKAEKESKKDKKKRKRDDDEEEDGKRRKSK